MSMRKWLASALALTAVGYMATGVSIVQQDEIGIVRRFGAVLTEPWTPGLHLGLPLGMDRIDRVKRDQARTIRIGASRLETAPLSRAPDPDSEDFLTGDLNLVTAEAQVQFRVIKPEDYLFSSRSADVSLASLAESVLTRELAARAIDDVLTTGRTEIAEGLRREIQRAAEAHRLGILVRDVRLGRVTPPAAVAPAFADADRARSDKRQAVTKAMEYRDRIESEARSQTHEIADRATAAFETTVQAALGEADRFSAILAEVRKNPLAARRRLYRETLAELLPLFARKVVVPRGENIDLSIISEGPK